MTSPKARSRAEPYASAPGLLQARALKRPRVQVREPPQVPARVREPSLAAPLASLRRRRRHPGCEPGLAPRIFLEPPATG